MRRAGEDILEDILLELCDDTNIAKGNDGLGSKGLNLSLGDSLDMLMHQRRDSSENYKEGALKEVVPTQYITGDILDRVQNEGLRISYRQDTPRPETSRGVRSANPRSLLNGSEITGQPNVSIGEGDDLTPRINPLSRATLSGYAERVLSENNERSGRGYS